MQYRYKAFLGLVWLLRCLPILLPMIVYACEIFQEVLYLSLSRLNHGQPGVQVHPEIVEGTAELHHEIADALLPQPDAVFHNATTLHTAVDMLNPQSAVGSRTCWRRIMFQDFSQSL